MSMLNTINNYGILIIATVGAMAAVAFALFFYFVKIRKVSADEENVDYSKFVRTDVSEFCKFDNIIRGYNDMGIIALGRNMFIGGIEVSGYNFGSASYEDRERTMHNAIAFFNTIENPVQLCQNVQNIDISQNIREYRERAEEIELRLLEVQSEIRIGAENLQRFVEDDAMYELEEKRVKRLTHTMSSLEWQLEEAKEMIFYMEKVSDASVNTKRTNQLIFSYIYNPDNDIEELSEEEIIVRAEQELRNQAEIYGAGLENTGCSWKVLTADDFVELLRRHFHPITADETRLEDLLNSSYSSLYISTDSLREMAKERKSEIDYEREMQEFEQLLRQKSMEAEAVREATVKELEKKAAVAAAT